MKRTGRNIILFLLAALIALPGLRFASRAEGEEKENKSAPPETACSRVLCCNLEYDRVLLEKGADEVCAPASFTKLMTALLAYDYRREAGNVTVTVTEEMLSGAGGTSIHLKENEVLDFDSLLKGLVVNGANDAALVIASTVGGNVSAFVDQMNRRAEEMGMTNTYYANPTGVDSAVMHTTLRDTLILCRALYRVNDFMVLASEEKVSIPATNLTQERVFTNKNALIPFSYVTDYMVRGARGFIAGYTAMAGYCCATCRTASGATTLVLLSGGTDRSENENGRQITTYRDAATLLDWARDNFAVTEVISRETVLCERKVRLSGGVDHTVLAAGETLKTLLPKEADLTTEIRTEIRTEKEVLDAPILKGTKYGEADLYYGEELLGTVDLVAQANVSLSRYLMVWDGVVRFFSTGPAHVFLVIIISAAALYVVILIATVYIQYLRNTRERRMVIREMEERENRRLREVRRGERQKARRTLRRAHIAMKQAASVIAGRDEALGSGRAVARVPEKYRKNTALEAPPRTETQNRMRPINQCPAAQRPTAQRPVAGKSAAYRPMARPANQRPINQRPANQRPTNQRPANQRPAAQKPAGQRAVPRQPNAGNTAPRRPTESAPRRPQTKPTVRKWPD